MEYLSEIDNVVLEINKIADKSNNGNDIREWIYGMVTHSKENSIKLQPGQIDDKLIELMDKLENSSNKYLKYKLYNDKPITNGNLNDLSLGLISLILILIFMCCIIYFNPYKMLR